jgi:hypothetical protein
MVLFIILLLLPLSIRAQGYTGSRGMFIGGYVGMYKSDFNSHDDSYNSKDRTFDIDARVGYFIRNNLALGVRVGYERTTSDFTTVSDLSNDLSSRSKTLRLGLFMRNYFRLGRRIRFFVETGAVAGFGSLEYHDSLYGPTHTETGDLFTFKLGFMPGVVIFLNRGLAVEATAGFFGLSYRKTKSDDAETGVSVTVTDLDFSSSVNALRIQLGIAIYL